MNKLYAGVGRQNITPELGGHLAGYGWDLLSESIHDDLTATALVLRQADVTMVLISVTVTELAKWLSESIKEQIGERYNVDPKNVLLAATHTHSAPCTFDLVGWGEIDRAYCENIYIPGVLHAVDLAFSNLQPAVMGVGETQSFVGINRRQYGPDGEVILGQNPWGQIDTTMTVMAFRTEEGKPFANIVHYGAHGTAAGENYEVTRDWSGIMLDRLDEESGAVSMFFNGTAGDIGPRLTNGGTKGDIRHVRELGGVAAMDAVRAYKSIRCFQVPELKTHSGTLTLPYAPIPSLEDAKAGFARFRNLEQTNMHMHYADHFRKIIDAYESGFPARKGIELQQTVFKIGDVVLAPYGFELFSEIGLRMREYSPAKHTLCVCYENDNPGYLPSQDQLCRGGYEVEMFMTGGTETLAPDTDSILIRETLRLINQL